MPKHPRIGRRVACKRSGTVPRSNDQTAPAGASKERISSHGVKGACQFGDNSMVIPPCGIRKASQASQHRCGHTFFQSYELGYRDSSHT